MPGFIIWSAVCVLLLGIGIRTLKAGEPAGFFAGVKPPEVTDARKYNRAVAALWFVYAALFELLGLPLLFLKQNPALFVVSVLGVAMITIGLAAAYHRVLEKYRRRGGK